MNEVLASQAAAGHSIHGLVVLGLILVFVLACFGRVLAGFVLLVPTLMLAGIDSLMPGGSSGGTHPSSVPWGLLLLFGLLTLGVVAAVVVGLVLLHRGSSARRGWYPDDGVRSLPHLHTFSGPGEFAEPQAYADLRVDDALGPPPVHLSRYRVSVRFCALTQEFLSALVSSAGLPRLLDPADALTEWFVDALSHVALLLSADGDPARLAAALAEAERRWTIIRGRGRPQADGV